MNDLLFFILVFIGNLALCAFVSGIMYTIQYRKSIRPIGSILIELGEHGTYTWDFRFNEGVTYDAIANMNSVRFKIVYKERKNESGAHDINKAEV